MDPFTVGRLILLGVAMLSSQWKRLRLNGTTMVAPFRWTIFSLSLLLVVDIGQVWLASSEATLQALKYVVATSTFLPLVSLLGAKRPQNVGWQFIVVTLWVVLILPAGEMFILWSGGAVDEGPMRQWLFVILMFTGLTNFIFTRFRVPALVFVVGQIACLWEQLPFSLPKWANAFEMGVCLISLSPLLVVLLARRRGGDGWSGVWCDFRDMWGLVWGLRVMERVNATGRLCGWSAPLTWYGFAQAERTEGEARQISKSMRTVLRRFVSPEWIDVRLVERSDETPKDA